MSTISLSFRTVCTSSRPALLLAAPGPRVPRSERSDHPGIPPLVECVHPMVLL